MKAFFKKLFGKKSVDIALPTALLDEEKYWNIITKSKIDANNSEDQFENLKTELQQLTPTELLAFQLQSARLVNLSYSSHLWCAAYIMNGGCSDDGFEYFRRWLIAQGKMIFYSAIKNADSLAEFDFGNTKDFQFEDLYYAVYKVFEKKTGLEFYDIYDNAEMKIDIGNLPDIEFDWEEEDDESMKRICPKLYKKYSL